MSDESHGLDKIDSNSRQFISEVCRHYEDRERSVDSDCVRPGTSTERDPPRGGRDASPEGRAEQLIREAEANKAKIYGPPGKEAFNSPIPNQFLHSAMVDETYMLVATHLDDNIIKNMKSTWILHGFWLGTKCLMGKRLK